MLPFQSHFSTNICVSSLSLKLWTCHWTSVPCDTHNCTCVWSSGKVLAWSSCFPSLCVGHGQTARGKLCCTSCWHSDSWGEGGEAWRGSEWRVWEAVRGRCIPLYRQERSEAQQKTEAACSEVKTCCLLSLLRKLSLYFSCALLHVISILYFIPHLWWSDRSAAHSLVHILLLLRERRFGAVFTTFLQASHTCSSQRVGPVKGIM